MVVAQARTRENCLLLTSAAAVFANAEHSLMSAEWYSLILDIGYDTDGSVQLPLHVATREWSNLMSVTV